MEKTTQLQVRTNSELPSVATAQDIARVRLDETRYPHYADLEPASRMRWLAEQVKYLASVARIRDYDAREAILTATALDDMIVREKAVGSLTLPEMVDSFKSGLFGLYGEFYGLSAPNLYGFLVDYIGSDRKKAATAIVFEEKKRMAEERKRAEKEEEQRRLREEIEEAKRNGSFVPTGKAWFEPKTVKEAVDESAHREMVRKQAREILNAHRHADTD